MNKDMMRTRRPALLMRIFGWSMFSCLFTYFLNNYFVVTKELPSITGVFSNGLNSFVFIQAGIYLTGFLLALFYVLGSRSQSLRADASIINRFNKFLVRGFFWSVVFVGFADMVISFLRVEGLLSLFVGPELFKELGRASFRGPYVHYPLVLLGFIIACFTRTLGFHWLALLIVVAELVIVITRFIFSYEQAFMGDLVRFWYAALFLFASAYTLLEEGHVRVDVFYSMFSRRTKGRVNSFGSIFLGMTLCWTILIVGFKSKAAVIYSPLSNFEVSQSGFGMYTKYWMAGFLAVFAITMLIQFISQMFESYADFRDDPGGKETQDADQPPHCPSTD